MKRILMIGMIAGAAIGLAACNKTASDIATTITTSVQDTKTKVKSVQNYTVSLCSYLPAVASITALFNSNYSQNVAIVGTAICNAVTSIPLADGPGDRKPRVNGIVIKGKFLR